MTTWTPRYPGTACSCRQTVRKVVKFMEAPADAIAAMATFVDRSRRKSSVNFPVDYVRRADGLSPMSAQLLRSGGLRLKLHMTLVMRATKAPHTLTLNTTNYLARLMNVPGSNGARRINEALKWMEQQRLIERITLRDGKKGLRLLKPDGSGDGWETRAQSRWVGVPLTFWSNSWIYRLDGKDIAVLMALLELNGGFNHPDGELMGGHRKTQYDLAADTWTRGARELEALELLRTTRVKFGDEELEFRVRKRYRPSSELFSSYPTWDDTGT